MVFHTFLNLSLNFAVSTWWSEPKSAPGLVFADYLNFSPCLVAKNIISVILVFIIWSWIEEPGGLQSMGLQRVRHDWVTHTRTHTHTRWCPCVELSSVVKKACFLWPVCSRDKTLVAFFLFHFVFQGQTCLLLQLSLDFVLLHSNPLRIKEHLFLVLVLEGLVHLHGTVQPQLLWH